MSNYQDERFDAFGFDPILVDKTINFFDKYYSYWHRVDAKGLENIPEEGAAILFGNHAGFNLLDGLMLAVAARKRSQAGRFIRGLYHIGSEKLPVFGSFLNNRLGSTLGHPRNIDYLLEKGELVLTYPEGGKSSSKPFGQRRNLCPIDEFGSGFIKCAIRHQVPVIPVATIGCQEAIPTLFISRRLGAFFKFDGDAYPVSPQSILTVPPSFLGIPAHFFNFLIGFPSKIKIHVGKPILLPATSEEDDIKVKLYNGLQDMIYELDDSGKA